MNVLYCIINRIARCTEKTIFPFLSHMGYDRDDSFPFEFELNGIPFGSKNRKEKCHHIAFNVKGNGNIVFSVYCIINRIERRKIDRCQSGIFLATLARALAASVWAAEITQCFSQCFIPR